MQKLFLKITLLLFFTTTLCFCNKRVDQTTMFHGREHKSKKKGIYDAGLNSKKPISVQTAEDINKLSGDNTNPKKAAKKGEKELKKKQKESQKARDKHNKKRHLKVKTTKGKPEGEK